MTTGSGDLERATSALLTAELAQVGCRCRGLRRRRRGRRVGRRRIAQATQVGDRFGQVRDRHRLDAGERHLRTRLGRTDHPFQAGPPCTLGRDERAGNRPEAAVERQLADRGMPCERIGRELLRCSEDGKRDREVEPRSLLPQPGGSEVDGEARTRPLELGRRDAAAYPVLRLLAGAVGQTHDREGRRATLQVRFDLDAPRVEADERVGDSPGEHVATLGDKV